MGILMVVMYPIGYLIGMMIDCVVGCRYAIAMENSTDESKMNETYVETDGTDDSDRDI